MANEYKCKRCEGKLRAQGFSVIEIDTESGFLCDPTEHPDYDVICEDCGEFNAEVGYRVECNDGKPHLVEVSHG